MIIWRTDASGKLGRDEEEENPYRKCHAQENMTRYKRKENVKGNGTYVAKICQRHHTIPTITWKSQKWKKANGRNSNTKKI